jgi:ligand-binding SRPBCC domain-containing protein
MCRPEPTSARACYSFFGVIPFGYDNITVAQIEPGRMFREESAMTGMRTWIHQRTLEPVDGRTIVTDAITFVPRLRIPGLKRFLSPALAAFFGHRHRRLQQHLAS